MKADLEEASLIVWVISPWSGYWSMGTGAGMPSLYYHLQALVDAGYEVHLFALNDGFSSAEEVCEGIRIHRFRVPLERQILALRRILPRIRFVGPVGLQLLQMCYVLLYTLAAIRRARQEGKKARPCLIYGYSSYSVLAAYILGRLYHVPNITRLFGIMSLHHALSSRVSLLLEWQQVLAFKVPCRYLIVTNDGTQGDKAARRLGVPDGRLKFWRNGVNKSMYNPSSDVADFKKQLDLERSSKVILSVSRLVRGKRKDRLVNAVPSIVARHKEARFLIVGDGPERENLESLSRDLGVSEHVRFLGVVPYEHVADYANAADICVLVNDDSNVSNGLYEAMVCGKCIVTLDNGDTGELIVDGKTGRLIRVGTEDEIVSGLASAIVEVLDDDELRTRLGENAGLHAQEHFQTWEERMAMEVRLVDELVGKVA